jgi:hypothetical protein
MTVKCLMLAVVVGLSATLASAQSHSLMFEQAIFAEDTAGDLDGAIRMYERLASTPGAPDEIVRMARERLATVSVRRNQRTQVAAAQQAKPTGRPGQVDPAPATPQGPQRGAPPRGSGPGPTGGPPPLPFRTTADTCRPGEEPCGMFANFYDRARPIVVSGTVVFTQWMNPLTLLVINGNDGNRWSFTLPPPNALIRGGLNRDSFKLGEPLMVSGFLAVGASDGCGGNLPHGCTTLADGSLHASAAVITSNVDGRRIYNSSTFNRVLTEEERRRAEERAAPPTLFRLNDPLPLLSFSNASVRDILKAVGLLAGINVTFDGNYVDPRPYSVEMKGATLEQALNQITTANQLSYKVLDERTILISNDTSPKR